MDPITIGLIAGAGLGLLKSEQDKKREKADRKVAAITAQWSPWTHMAPEPVQRADQMGAIMQGGMAGAAMGQNVQGQQQYADYLGSLNGQQAAPMPQQTNVAPPPSSWKQQQMVAQQRNPYNQWIIG